MFRHPYTVLIAFVTLLMSAPHAIACAAYITDHSPEAERARTKAAIARADVIMDAEVVVPHTEDGNVAILRAHRVFKGPDQELFEVGWKTYCDRYFEFRGERMRILLVMSDGVYTSTKLSEDSRRLDWMLGSDRLEDWPYFPGELAPAEPPRGDAP